ncbi:hypothetical protein J1N35_024961 [Gossypium stocksii]|uniref:Reverse transcriptase domain-containing protein n=1 Tax=Gossypium stocksii TaxID=47602 RepID=A0A9D3ZXU9_9ROSI|nr:hypothetical protein J1N35_024961 [Gossypium stocksii]
MAPFKAPGVDRLHAHFYQSQWNIVGEFLVGMVKRVFEGDNIESFFNKTLIVLIPKVLTKVIVNRLKPIMSSLITANQTSFIGGRNIMDNVIIDQKVIHLMWHKKGKNGWMAIKIDMEKAYDRLRWSLMRIHF